LRVGGNLIHKRTQGGAADGVQPGCVRPVWENERGNMETRKTTSKDRMTIADCLIIFKAQSETSRFLKLPANATTQSHQQHLA